VRINSRRPHLRRCGGVSSASPQPIVIIVIAAAALSGLLENASETLAILANVLLNGLIGFIQ
jgi:hypothetical protein